MSYQIIKLTNGDTIMGEVVHEDEDVTTVLEPLSLIVNENEEGRPVMVALTWVPLLKKVNAVHLKTDHVVAMSELEREMTLYYKRSLAQLRGDLEEFEQLMSESTPDDRLHWNDDEVLEEKDEVMEEYLSEITSEISEQIISANTVH